MIDPEEIHSVIDTHGSIGAAVDAIRSDDIEDAELRHWWGVAEFALSQIESRLTSVSG